MKIKKIIKVFVFVISLIALQISSASGQAQQYNKVINKKGWKIHKTENLEIKNETQIEIEEIDVTEKKFQIGKDKPYITLIENLDCEFRNLSSYSINKKTFAFEGNCVLFKTDGDMQYYTRAMMRLFIFDEDGDGKFESSYNSSKMKIFVPDYFKIKKPTKSATQEQ